MYTYTHTNKLTDEVFYVGKSRNKDSRPYVRNVKQRNARWSAYFTEHCGGDKDNVLVTITEHPSEGAALQAEWELIQRLRPVGNIEYNPDEPNHREAIDPETILVDFFGTPVRCETDGLMVSLTDLTRAGNQWRVTNGLPTKTLGNILDTQGFADFLAVAQADMPDKELIRVEGKGSSKRTMAHVLLAVYVAEQFSPKFHYDVIKTFVEGKLSEFRDHGGTEFKALNAALDLHSDAVLGKQAHKGHFIRMATIIRKRILREGQDWNTASVAQTHQRYEVEQTLVKLLELGVVRDWEHLKDLIEKV